MINSWETDPKSFGVEADVFNLGETTYGVQGPRPGLADEPLSMMDLVVDIGPIKFQDHHDGQSIGQGERVKLQQSRLIRFIGPTGRFVQAQHDEQSISRGSSILWRMIAPIGPIRSRECFYKAFEEEIHQVIVENQLFKPGERIVIGSSGGKGAVIEEKVCGGPNDEKLRDFQEFNIEEEPHQMAQPSSLEALMMEFTAKNDALIQRQASSLRKLENQCELFVNDLCDKLHETLGINMENAKEEEESKNVILRNGDELEILGENFEQLQVLTSIQSSEEKDEEARISSLSTFVVAHNVVAFS
uniref:Uncharacterized protein n=1 Tax=Cannabis sativa TaxID=3483 RepID=A0A803P429_CANSA